MDSLNGLGIIGALLIAGAATVGVDTSALAADATQCSAFARELGQLSRGEMPVQRLLKQDFVRELETSVVVPWNEVEAKLRDEFDFAPRALDAALEFASHFGGSIALYEAAGSNPFMALSGMEGSLHCQGTIFFVPSDSEYQQAEILANEHTYVCWNDHATIVTSQGEPLVLISHEDPRQSRLTVYRVAALQAKSRPCDLQIDFNVDYEVDPATCSDATCRQMAPALIGVARKLDGGWPAAFGELVVNPTDVPSVVISSLQAINTEETPREPVYFAANFDDDPDAEFLAVEQNPDQSFLAYFVDMSEGVPKAPLKLELQGFPPSRSPWTTFAEPSYLLPMSQDGKVYLVHIGAGSFGWRPLEGYLATVYEWSGDQFNLIAGAQLNRVNASVRAITELH